MNCSSPLRSEEPRITQAQPVGKTAKGVQPYVGHDPRPAGFNNHVGRAATFHFGNALLVGNLVSRQQQFPLLGGLFRGRGQVGSGGPVNDQG